MGAQAFEMRFHLFLNLCVVAMAVETPTNLTLRTAIGTEQIILRANIKTLQSTGLSLMPPASKPRCRQRQWPICWRTFARRINEREPFAGWP